jgi:hypothetical protein
VNKNISTLFVTTAAAAFLASAAMADTTPAAAPPPPPPTAAPYPAMSADIAMPAPPTTVDLGLLGKVSVGGVLSAFAQTQSNPVFNGITGKGDQTSTIDLSNAQIFINKSDGVFQYFIEAGTYSLPQLGPSAYQNSAKTPGLTFGNLPQGFVKIVPNSTFSVEVGALPTLVGDEYTFSFENLNVERGLLWAYEPAVSRGVQVNVAQGPLAVSVAFTDGYYSNKYNAISGLATWTIDASDTLAADFETPLSKQYASTFVTSPVLNNQTIFNLMYTRTQGPWIINPYIQYVSVPTLTKLGYTSSETSWGAALLLNYTFDAKSPLAGFSVPLRVEYVSNSGSPNPPAVAPDLLFSPGSKEWSFTITPTYQYKNYFIRVEASYVNASKVDPYAAFFGTAYGSSGDKKDQIRGIVETGVAF